MAGPLPRPLDDSFGDLLADIARTERLPSHREPDRLAPLVAALSHAYNDPSLRGLSGVGAVDHRAARLGFSFARDVPKSAGAVRELVALGRLALPAKGPLRVLDLGAGLGASHRGVARALDAVGLRGTMDVLAVDADGAALRLARAIAMGRPREGGVEIRLRVKEGDVESIAAGSSRASWDAQGRYDLVLLGQVLTELDLAAPDDERVERHRAFLARVVDELLEPAGVVVVVEPALRPRSRHLQRVRGALIDGGRARIIAPCLHEGRCPLLGRAGDWCHEDLAVDLPAWLVPVARSAGLRWEGLTFSYLVAASRGPDLRDLLGRPVEGDHGTMVRVVSERLQTKGKLELIVCGDPVRSGAPAEDPYGDQGARIGRLDREASERNAALDGAGRGALLEIASPLDEKLRVRRDGVIGIVDAGRLPTNADGASERPASR